MSAKTVDVTAVIDGIEGRTLPPMANMISLAAIGWGVLAFFYGYFAVDAAWTLGAYLVALLYVMAIAQGGVMFAIIQTGTWGRWGRPLKRIGEALGTFLPVVWLGLAVFLAIGGTTIYVWNPATIVSTGPMPLLPHSLEAYSTKEIWLTPMFFGGRLLIGTGILFGLSMLYIRASLKPDLIQAKARLGTKAPAWWDRIIGGETDLAKATEAGQNFQSNIFPFITWAYALVFSLVAFDLIMSLSPWWFSNMFGGWQFVSSVWLAFATMAVVAMVGLDWMNLKGHIKPSTTHDHGKLMLAMCMFWAYTTFAQLLPIWYTDMPEETDFLLVRLMLPQWSWLAQTVAIMCFLAPFTILLSRGIKKMRYPFAGIGVLIMAGVFLERSLLVMPSIYFGDTFPTMNFLIINLGMLAGALGLMTQWCGRFLASTPTLVTSDPYLEPHPWDVHVHSLDAHH